MTGEVPLNEAAADVEAEVGGEAACWAHLVCPQCGAMESEGHQRGCPAATAPPADQRR